MAEKKAPSAYDRVASAIDGAIGLVSPSRMYKRIAYRKASIMAAASYRGADKSRLRADWYPGGYSADRDMQFDHATLRERSRDLNRNDAFASGITNTIVINDIGIGIKPQSRVNKDILGISEDQMAEFHEAAEAAWALWVSEADAGERMDFYEMQALIDRQILENGEAIIIPIRKTSQSRIFSLALAPVEADRLQTPSDMNGNASVRFGVKIGADGEPLEYYIRKKHPGDIYSSLMSQYEYMTYQAKNKFGTKNVFHMYEIKRPGQTRGIPYFAPVLSYFKDLGDYSEAELVAARIAACFALFIKKADAYQAFNQRSTVNDKDQRVESMEPGMIEYLGDGEDITSANPNRPNAQFEPFVNYILKAICTALNLSYEIVSKDFSKSTYSSARAGLLQAYRYFRGRQEWMSRKINQPVWDMVLEEAFLKGMLPSWLDSVNFYTLRPHWARARWIAPGWQWVDPLKEAQASELAIDMGLSTLADEAAAQGKDWEEIIGQRAREAVKIKELEDKNGIKIINKSTAKNQSQDTGGQNGQAN